jgi:hypothetical protein
MEVLKLLLNLVFLSPLFLHELYDYRASTCVPRVCFHCVYSIPVLERNGATVPLYSTNLSLRKSGHKIQTHHQNIAYPLNLPAQKKNNGHFSFLHFHHEPEYHQQFLSQRRDCHCSLIYRSTMSDGLWLLWISGDFRVLL